MITLEYMHVGILFVVLSYALYSMYRLGRNSGISVMTGVAMESALSSFDITMNKLQEDKVITMGEDEQGRMRAYPGTVDLTVLESIISKLDDETKAKEIRDSMSVILK